MPTLNITGKTAVYGILAHPTDHVRAPQVFNAAYEAAGIDAVLVPLDVKPEDLATVVAALKVMRNLHGLTVTVPHKVAMAELCDELAPGGERVGSVNAIRFAGDGRMLGDNFDGKGYVTGMEKAGYDFTGKKVLQLGAGGAGMSIAFSVAEAGAAEIAIANRTVSKAEALGQRVQAAFPGTRVTGVAADADPAGYDLVINTTSLGLHDGDALPVDVDRLSPGTAVSEIIMTPVHTELLKRAEAKGHPIYFGKPMLDEQIKLIGAFMGCPLPD